VASVTSVGHFICYYINIPGRKIDILFGALILEEWGTVIDESTIPPKIDYTILRKGELVELKGTRC